MKAHFDRAHPSADQNDYQQLWMRTELEEDKLTSVWNTRLVVPKKRRSRKAQIMPVVISEAHRARIPEA